MTHSRITTRPAQMTTFDELHYTPRATDTITKCNDWESHEQTGRRSWGLIMISLRREEDVSIHRRIGVVLN